MFSFLFDESEGNNNNDFDPSKVDGWDYAFFLPNEYQADKHENPHIDLWTQTCEGKSVCYKTAQVVASPMILLASLESGVSPRQGVSTAVGFAASEFLRWLKYDFPLDVQEHEWETLKLIISRSTDTPWEEVLDDAEKSQQRRVAEKAKQNLYDSFPNPRSEMTPEQRTLEELFKKSFPDEH
jgi:phage terminase large subunit GpA-like protein